MYQKITTLGPSSFNAEQITNLLEVSTCFRLNIAHLTSEQLEDKLNQIQQIYYESRKELPVVLDLQGAKVRIGKCSEHISLPEQVILIAADKSDETGKIPVAFSSVFENSEPGDRLHLNDAKVILEIEKVSSEEIQAKVIANGPLCSGKGLNSPTKTFELAQVANCDKKAIKIGMKYPWVHFAVSFVNDGIEANIFRPLISERKMIAKIEQISAFDHLEKIDSLFDELWLCRGDLGAEVGFNKLGRLQEEFIKAFPKLKKPKILAGEVLGSMVNQPQPSRSEIVHLYSILKSGFNGIVLSDETACGNYLQDVIKFLENFNPDFS